MGHELGIVEGGKLFFDEIFRKVVGKYLGFSRYSIPSNVYVLFG